MPRVMLERPNYFQKLVDLGCDPDALGTVTWNSTTRSVDVSGSVYLGDEDLTRLPFQFGKVGGYFWCPDNRLTSLEGAPKEVGGDFGCSTGSLTDVSALRGCKIKGVIYLFGPEADQVRVMELLRAQGYKGSIV
jgi:hypothetical protein